MPDHGWVEKYDEEFMETFYFNTKSGASHVLQYTAEFPAMLSVVHRHGL